MRQTWQLWEGTLSPELCDSYTRLCKETCTLEDGSTFNSDISHRKTKIGWTNLPQLKQLAKDYSDEANRAAFGFDVSFIPSIQFGEYTSGSFYGWHHDIDWTDNKMYDRKLSIVVQLSDPTTYSGGDFEFKTVETPQAFKTQGSILVFPSYLEHQVTSVTEGTRHSLVCWAEGPRWR
jgi:PKHD-type hydroxylase|tara:strand:+ start:3128 stop:3658 length:531 start_codon:yes stop_codon:yes gene_type:complete